MLLLAVPFAALTAAGGLLWKRWKSAATVMISLGFGAVFLCLLVALFDTYKTHAVLVELTSSPRARQDTYFVTAHFNCLALLGILGMWVAAAGTLWHVNRQR